MIEPLLIGLTRFVVGGQALWTGSEPNLNQRIYFANHGSHLDTLLIWAALPPALRRKAHPVAAADYWSGGLRGYIADNVLRVVLVERRREKNGADAPEPKSDALDPLKAVLAEGESLILFPEGTRTAEPLPGPFRSGLFRLAEQFPLVELVPVYLENPARAWPKGALLPAPISCSVHFGAPLHFRPDEPKDVFLDRARQAVTALAPRMNAD
jgi:1-acyl-sn-glycerol-3-phosphate acyltransferase